MSANEDRSDWIAALADRALRDRGRRGCPPDDRFWLAAEGREPLTRAAVEHVRSCRRCTAFSAAVEAAVAGAPPVPAARAGATAAGATAIRTPEARSGAAFGPDPMRVHGSSARAGKLPSSAHRAWERIYGTYRPVIASLAGRAGLSARQAEDVVQDVLVRLCRDLPTLTGVPPGELSLRVEQLAAARIADATGGSEAKPPKRRAGRH